MIDWGKVWQGLWGGKSYGDIGIRPESTQWNQLSFLDRYGPASFGLWYKPSYSQYGFMPTQGRYLGHELPTDVVSGLRNYESWLNSQTGPVAGAFGRYMAENQGVNPGDYNRLIQQWRSSDYDVNLGLNNTSPGQQAGMPGTSGAFGGTVPGANFTPAFEAGTESALSGLPYLGAPPGAINYGAGDLQGSLSQFLNQAAYQQYIDSLSSTYGYNRALEQYLGVGIPTQTAVMDILGELMGYQFNRPPRGPLSALGAMSGSPLSPGEGGEPLSAGPVSTGDRTGPRQTGFLEAGVPGQQGFQGQGFGAGEPVPGGNAIPQNLPQRGEAGAQGAMPTLPAVFPGTNITITTPEAWAAALGGNFSLARFLSGGSAIQEGGTPGAGPAGPVGWVPRDTGSFNAADARTWGRFMAPVAQEVNRQLASQKEMINRTLTGGARDKALMLAEQNAYGQVGSMRQQAASGGLQNLMGIMSQSLGYNPMGPQGLGAAGLGATSGMLNQQSSDAALMQRLQYQLSNQPNNQANSIWQLLGGSLGSIFGNPSLFK